jgi:hypothetical protein
MCTKLQQCLITKLQAAASGLLQVDRLMRKVNMLDLLLGGKKMCVLQP